jgi:hypothetical protein
MNYFDYLDSTGYILASELPDECISDCSAQGSVDEAVEYWVKQLDFEAPEQNVKEYLGCFGAWDDDELSDNDSNLQRLLWVVCCDLKEERKAQYE